MSDGNEAGVIAMLDIDESFEKNSIDEYQSISAYPLAWRPGRCENG